MGSLGGVLAQAVTPVQQLISPVIGQDGQFLQGTAKAVTPQNEFQASSAPITQQNFQPNLSQTYGGLNQNIQNQNAIAGQLQAEGQGMGPNPALLQQQAASQNAIKQSTGQLASMRGISPALAQRMAAESQAAQGQQAAQNGALLQAQQQLGAQSAAGNLYGQAGGQQNQLYGTLQNAQAAQNNALTGMQSNLNNVNQQVASQNTTNLNGTIGKFGQAAMALANGGEVPNRGYGFQAAMALANGGEVPNWGYGLQPQIEQTPNGASSQAGQFLNGPSKTKSPAPGASDSGPVSSGDMAGGPMDSGGAAGSAATMFAARGGAVGGTAMLPGNNIKNDTVPAVLSPKEIVLPRTVTMAKDAPEKAKAFVEAILARKGLKKGLT